MQILIDVGLLISITGLMVHYLVWKRMIEKEMIELARVLGHKAGEINRGQEVLAREILKQSYDPDLDEYWISPGFAALCDSLRLEIPADRLRLERDAETDTP